jgi:TolB-like protein
VVVASFETSHAADEELRLAATLRDEVVAGLSRFRDLRVVADPRSIDLVSGSFPSDHEAAYILGATLRASREGGRLTARLLRVRDLYVIWSDGLEAPGLDVVDTIDSIIARVVGAVLPMIDSDLVRNASHLPSAPIYERYVLARDAAARARTYDQARAAAQELEALIQSKPSFALPYLPLAFLYNTDFWYTRAWSSSPDLKERALELGKTALALDRGHVHGYTICGWSYLRRRQWEPARIYLEQAFALNPFHPRRVMEVGYAFLFLGDTERARKLLNRHLLLNPEPDDFYYMDLGLLSFIEGDLDMSASYLELIANPDIWGLLYRAMTAKAGGFASEAKIAAALERLRAIWPSNVPMSADNVVTWISTHNPFQSAETDARFLAAVRDILPAA